MILYTIIMINMTKIKNISNFYLALKIFSIKKS